MRYLKARLDESFREHMYRIYVTDMMAVATGTKERYAELIKPAQRTEETRTEQEVRDYYKNKINETEEEES